jgi:hypothetical protein
MIGGDAAQIPADGRRKNIRSIDDEDDDIVSAPKQPGKKSFKSPHCRVYTHIERLLNYI